MGAKNRATASRNQTTKTSSVKVKNKESTAAKKRIHSDIKQGKQQRREKRANNALVNPKDKNDQPNDADLFAIDKTRLPIRSANGWIDPELDQKKQQLVSRLERKRKAHEAGLEDEEPEESNNQQSSKPSDEDNDLDFDSETGMSDVDMSDEESNDQDGDKAPAAAPIDSAKAAEAMALRRHRLRLEIAELADSLLSSDHSKLAMLHRMHQLTTDPDTFVARLAIVSEVAVICDMIPSYRIRAHSDEEIKHSQHAAETRAVWEREAQLLKAYERVVAFLTGKSKKRGVPDISIVKSLAELTVKAYHFNHRDEVLVAITHLLNHNDRTCRSIARGAVVQLFHHDVAGDAALVVVSEISKIVKKRGFAVQAEVIACLTECRLDAKLLMSKPERAPKPAQRGGKKAKPANVDEYALQRDLAEGDANVAQREKQQNHTNILTQIFLVYFTLLRTHSSGVNQQATILQHILQGITKYALLINADLLIDMCLLLQQLIDPAREPRLPISSVFLAASALLAIMKHGHGNALTLDLKQLFGHVYTAITELMHVENWRYIDQALACLHKMFENSKNVPASRAAAFVQRISMIALHCPPVDAAAMLMVATTIVRSFSSCDSLFDGEDSGAASFDAKIDDPDIANAFASQCFGAVLPLWSHHPSLVPCARDLVMPRAERKFTDVTAADFHSQLIATEAETEFPLPIPASLKSKKARYARRVDAGHRSLLVQARELTQPSSFLQECLDLNRQKAETQSKQ